MPTRLRKNRRMRGTRTVGYGQIGQHRRRKGGTGKAGRHKFKWSWVTTYDPDYFGVHGFRPPHPNTTRTWISVGDLESLHTKLVEKGATEEEQGIPLLNLTKLGIGKLLGSGSVSTAFNVVVPKFTARAKVKIEGVGGKVQEA
jgi:large subunit ribosomal protein L15